MSARSTTLVAEDDSGIRQIIRTRLEGAGSSVETARNGIEARQLLASYLPEGLILDINMPLMDGFGVLMRLQATPQMRPPTLVLTARHAADDVKRAVKLGAKDYLTKPFSETQLLARVGRLMHRLGDASASGDLLI